MPVDDSSARVFVSRFNRGMSVAVWAVLIAFGTSLAWLPGGPERLVGIVPLAALGALTYVGLWLPQLTVSDDQLVVRNVLRTVTIPWKALVHVDTKYSLTLYVPGRAVNVFAAPAPGAVTAARLARRYKRAGKTISAPRPGDLKGTDSGDAAELVRDRWGELQRDHRIEAGVADKTKVARHWNTDTVAVIGGGIAASALALFLR